MKQDDVQWLERLDSVIRENAGGLHFTIDVLAEEMMMSRTQLFPRVRKLTGKTPNQYLQDVRFEQALQMLQNKECETVKEVAYSVGYKDVKYFSREFKKRVGDSPSSYL